MKPHLPSTLLRIVLGAISFSTTISGGILYAAESEPVDASTAASSAATEEEEQSEPTDKKDEKKDEKSEEDEENAEAEPAETVTAFATPLSINPVMLAAAEDPFVWAGTSSDNIWSVVDDMRNFYYSQNTATKVAYEDGLGVEFGSSGTPIVEISGTVAPGNMVVNTNTASGTSGDLKFGYAFTGDVSAHIADYKDAEGNVITPTSITVVATSISAWWDAKRFICRSFSAGFICPCTNATLREGNVSRINS